MSINLSNKTEKKDKSPKKSKKKSKKKTKSLTVREKEIIKKLLQVEQFPEDLPYPYPDMSHKTTIMFYGDPKSGKSTTAMGAPGSYLALGYEAETNLDLIKANMYADHDRFQVKNFKPLVKKDDDDNIKETSTKVYDITMAVLENYYNANVRPDWILGDAIDVFKEIAEMKMREDKGLEAYAGTPNRNVWKQRNSFMDNFYNRCLTVAKRGAIFTSQNIIQETDDGKKKTPAWLGDLKGESVTEVFINSKLRLNKVKGEKIKHVFAQVKSCKLSHNEGEYEVTFIDADDGDGFKSSPQVLYDKIINSKNFKKVDGNKMYYS